MKQYQIVRQRIKHSKKVRTNFTKALRLTEDDYMKEFKEKAAKITRVLNNLRDGVGSSATFNLNMHQDYIANKLGLQKRVKGHDLIIKILLYKILGIKTNDEEMKKQIKLQKERSSKNSHRRNLVSGEFSRSQLKSENTKESSKDLNRKLMNKSAYSETRTSLHNYSSRIKAIKKPSTHQGNRLNRTFYHHFGGKKFLQNKDVISQQHKHTSSFDMTSNRKLNKDIISDDEFNLKTNKKEEMSPISTINCIIDK
jgi:hypothetical protein